MSKAYVTTQMLIWKIMQNSVKFWLVHAHLENVHSKTQQTSIHTLVHQQLRVVLDRALLILPIAQSSLETAAILHPILSSIRYGQSTLSSKFHLAREHNMSLIQTQIRICNCTISQLTIKTC